MLTQTLYIKSCDNSNLLETYQHEYTNLFYKLYNNPELLVDQSFVNSLLNEYIDKSIYDVCLSQVKTKLKQYQTSYNKKLKQINDISNVINQSVFKTKKEKRYKYNLINKLAFLKRTLNKNITFGGKELLRTITNQHIQIKQLSKTNQLDLIKSKQELLIKNKLKFKENRKLGFTFIGRAIEKGNRKFIFDLTNNTIIFKPNKQTKITINFTYKGNKTTKLLNQLQYLTDNKLMPLTVSIIGNKILLSYDNEYVNGYAFNENECKKEQSLHIDNQVKKEIYIKYKREQESRKLINKISNRYLAVDLNPNYIGISIFDSNDKNEVNKIIHTSLIDLTKLNKRLGQSSDNNKQLKQNNKRKYEISQVWKYIFNLGKHYKVYNFVMEDLNFNDNDKISKGKGFNRLVKNLWNRGLIDRLITKYCENNGLNKIEVNPIYSSFIGNMIYNYADAIASSLEIGRRGIVKYIKGNGLYPNISSINQEKLNYLLGENVDINGLDWKQLYSIISLLRYRNPHSGLLVNYLNSHKSKCLCLT